MSDKTGISWTDATWNPIRGCSVVSPGCTNCYAMNVAERFSGPGQPYEGLAHKVNGHAVWTGEVRLIEKHLEDPLKWKKPRRIFVNSMSDLFHEKVSDEWLDDIFNVMYSSRRHIFQILTKRPERMRDYITNRAERIYPQDVFQSRTPGEWWAHAHPHIWLGTSVEDQRRADERIPLLLETPAAVRFLSCEPLLGPISFRWASWLGGWRNHGHLDGLKGLHWIIVGGESGKGHRPMDLQWARDIKDQCVEAEVAFFFKQDSGLRPGTNALLDGIEWHQFPQSTGAMQEALAT